MTNTVKWGVLGVLFAAIAVVLYTMIDSAWAQERLGHCYEQGLGVDVDLKEAIQWYEKAAKQDNEDAKEALKRLKAK